MTVDDWRDDIRKAQAMSIDAFGLNIAFLDPNNDSSLNRAFQAAESLGSKFKLYLNFDYMAWGIWDVPSVVTKINQCKLSPAYFQYQGRPFVSTFEGKDNAHDWLEVNKATGCFFVPDWSSLGPVGAGRHLGNIADGLASWDAWPEGPRVLTTSSDNLYIKTLAGRPYMMPVSPWFYTNLPNYGKNWLWRSDDLWHYRWKQAIELAPHVQLVQIISWNDYGESHYIGPLQPAGKPAGSERYVRDFDHEAWGYLLPQYIAAYKRGRISDLQEPPLDGVEKLTYWYRVNPGLSGSAKETTGNNPNYQKPYPPHVLAEDKINLTVLLMAPSNITFRIGQGRPVTIRVQRAGISHITTPFSGRTGPVHFEISREGKVCLEAVGPEITTRCVDGNINWNPVVGKAHSPRLS